MSILQHVNALTHYITGLNNTKRCLVSLAITIAGWLSVIRKVVVYRCVFVFHGIPTFLRCCSLSGVPVISVRKGKIRLMRSLLLISVADRAINIVTLHISRLASELSSKDDNGNNIPETAVTVRRVCTLNPELIRFGMLELPEASGMP